MNILLTGGTGFIGRNVLESFLRQKYNILAPKHRDLELLNEDLVREFFKQNKIDVVIHAATKPGHRNAKEPGKGFYENTRMFFNLARNSEYFHKMLVIGSGAIYDMRYCQPKMTEEYFDTHVPVDEHGLCRYVCGKYIQKTDNIIDLRIFGIFGRYEDYAIRYISNMICKALFSLPLTIKQNRKFDYIYVNDLLPILDYFIQNNARYKEYNITPDNSIALLALAEKVRLIAGKNLPVVVAKEGMGLEYSGDNCRLKHEINGLKFTSIDEAIAELYEWYKENKYSINHELLLIDK
jgi:nucleoside-diphosphate-sugar epimerase